MTRFPAACLRAAPFVAACCLAFAATPAQAAPEQLRLTAGNMLAQTHSHAVIINITGTVRKLSGTLLFDPAAKTCRIDVTFNVKSTELPLIARGPVMSKSFLDPAQYPTMHYQGHCTDHGARMTGKLTMRGQTHPFDMTVSFIQKAGKPVQIDTAGTLDRYEWGLNGLSMLVGRKIRVTNVISLTGQAPQPQH